MNLFHNLFFFYQHRLLFLVIWLFMGFSIANAQSPILLKDLYVGGNNGDARHLTNLNSIVYFVAKDNDKNINSLWKTNGKPIGTVKITDLAGNATELTAHGKTIFFVADQPATGYEIWKSDGSAASTVLVKDVQKGIVGSMPSCLTSTGNTLFFVADDGINGSELWKTDGTATGTVLVKDIRAGSEGANPQWLYNHNGTLFFVANDGTSGYELWKSDGTAAGTVLVKDIRAGIGDSNPRVFTKVGSELFFAADDGINGCELWKINGNSTTLVADIRPGNEGSVPYSFTALGSTLYLVANNGTNGHELWKSNGTAAGTVQVRDIRTGEASSEPRYLASVGNRLYFSANDGAMGFEMWKSDGTAAGTVLVKDLKTGNNQSSNPRFLTAALGWVYFVADDGAKGDEIWKVNQNLPPVCVADLNPKQKGSVPRQLLAVGDTLYSVADDGRVGSELWRTEPCRVTARIPNKSLLVVCTQTSMTIKARASSCVGANYSWRSKPLGIVGNDTLINFTVPKVSSTQKHTFYFTATDGASSATDSIDVLIMPRTRLLARSLDTTICQHQSLALPNLISNYNEFYNHSWRQSSIDGPVVDTPNAIQLKDPTTYYLIAQSFLGCEDTTKVTVRTMPFSSEIVNIKVLLAGPYNSSTGLMATSLNQQGLLPGQKPESAFGVATPNIQPYSTRPWNYGGSEKVSSYTADIVDWVYVTLRTQPNDVASTVFKSAALLHRDGRVSQVEGCPNLQNNQAYYIGVDHRNHLGALSHQPVVFKGTWLVYDFTAQQSYIPPGVPAFGQQKIGAKYVLFAGDMQKDKVSEINASDSSTWSMQNGMFARYLSGDANLDGQVNASDNTIWSKNNGTFSLIKF